MFRSLRAMLLPNGAMAIVSSMRSRVDLASANLNMATSSMVGCTPLPELDGITAQLKESGFAQIKETQLAPGSALYGITATG
jgi:hypothetical protein